MRALLFPAVLLLTLPQVDGAQVPLPEPFPATRYEQMLEKSPFALATPPAPVEEKAPPAFANFVLTGVVPMRDEGALNHSCNLLLNYFRVLVVSILHAARRRETAQPVAAHSTL